MDNIGVVVTSDMWMPQHRLNDIIRARFTIVPARLHVELNEVDNLTRSQFDPDESYIHPRTVFTRMRDDSNLFPSTSQPNDIQYIEAFEKAWESVDNIICLPLLPKHSASFSRALNVANALTKQDFDFSNAFDERGYYTGNNPIFTFKKGDKSITVIDTKTVSAGLGHIVNRVYKSRDMDYLKVAELAAQAGNEVCIQVSIEDPRYIVKRVGEDIAPLQMQSMLSSAGKLMQGAFNLASLRLIIHVVDGEIERSGFLRGEQKAMRYMYEKIPDAKYETVIAHTGDEELVQKLEELTGSNLVTLLDPAVGVYVGPDRVGLISYPIS